MPKKSPALKSPFHPAETSNTPHLDAWIQQTLKFRAEVEEWCQQNKISTKKPEPTSLDPEDSGVHSTRPYKLPSSALPKQAGGTPADLEVTAETTLSNASRSRW